MGSKALVISGGGRNGSFSVGAIYALRSKYKINFDIVSGTSTGALQAGPILLDDIELLNDLYKNVTNPDVLDERGLLGTLLTGAMSGIGPLRKLVEKYLDVEKVGKLWPQKKMIVSATNLRTGELVRWTNSPQHLSKLQEYVIASAAMPVLMDPVQIDGDLYVDGGLIDTVPTEALFGLCENIDTIYVVRNFPPAVTSLDKNPSGLLEVLKRTIDILVAEVSRNDVVTLEQVNYITHLESQVAGGVPISIGSNTKIAKIVHIYPEHDLGDSLEFDPRKMKQIWRYGFKRAIQLVGSNT